MAGEIQKPRASASPKTAPRVWPTCIGPVGLAETNSTLTLRPSPTVERPNASALGQCGEDKFPPGPGGQPQVQEPRPRHLGACDCADRRPAAWPAAPRYPGASARRAWPAPSPRSSPCRHGPDSRGGSTATASRDSPSGSAPLGASWCRAHRSRPCGCRRIGSCRVLELCRRGCITGGAKVNGAREGSGGPPSGGLRQAGGQTWRPDRAAR